MQKLSLILFFLVVSFGIIFYFVYPKYQEVQRLNLENDALFVVAVEMRELIEKKNELEDIYNSISENDRKKLEALAPANPRMADFIVKMEILTGRNGVPFTSIGFTDTGIKDNPSLGTWSISLGMQGSYEAFRNYLKDIERFVRIMDVQAIGFGAPAEPGSPLSISFTGQMYQEK